MTEEFWKSYFDPSDIQKYLNEAIATGQAGVEQIKETLAGIDFGEEKDVTTEEAIGVSPRARLVDIPDNVGFGSPAEIWAKSMTISDIRKAAGESGVLPLRAATTSTLSGDWPALDRETQYMVGEEISPGLSAVKMPFSSWAGTEGIEQALKLWEFYYSSRKEQLEHPERQYAYSAADDPNALREALQRLFWYAYTSPKAYLEAARKLSTQQTLTAEIPFLSSWKYLGYIFTWDELVRFAIRNHVRNSQHAILNPYAGSGVLDAILPVELESGELLADPLGLSGTVTLTTDEAKLYNDWMLGLLSGAESTKDYSADDIAAVFRAQKAIYAEYADQWIHNDATDEYPDISSFQEPLKDVLLNRIQNWDSQPGPDDLNRVRDHELRLGLCKFKVPPTSINVEEKFMQLISPIPGIRMSSNPKFSSGHSNTVISLNLYFPDFESMWGVTYNEAIVAGEALKGTGSMSPNLTKEGIELDKQASSLRGLIAAFKGSPFLPVKNKYLNETYDIDAVTLLGMTITTSESFPHAVEVNLQLLKFNYQLYLPHAADFNNCILWGRYRHYLSKMMQRIDQYVSFSWLVAHSKPVEIKAREDVTEGVGTGTQEGETIGYRTYPWADDPRAYELKDLELFYVSETVGPSNYPQIYVYDDLVYERAEAWMDENIREARRSGWDGLLSALFGTQVADFSKWDFEEILGDPSFKDPAIYDLVTSMLGAEAMYSSVDPDTVEKVLAKYLVDIGYYRLPEEERAAVREEASLRVMQSVLVFIATSWMRSDDYKSLVNSALKAEGYGSIYEWEVPMVPLFLDASKVKVDAIAISLSNRIANLQLQLQDEPTHQHVGSGDTTCQISLTVQGESELKKLSEMVDRVQALSRYERSNACLGFWGVKNILTALAGMRYCLPVSLTYNTVPGQPHLYKVMLEVVDFDIFQQNRETLSQKERERLVAEFGKMNPFLRLKQNAKYFNCYPDLPLDIREDDEHVGYLEPDFYYVASAQETLRWIDEEKGGIVPPDSTGDKVYPWADLDLSLTAVSSADFDNDYLASIYLTRHGEGNSMLIGTPNMEAMIVDFAEAEEGSEELEAINQAASEMLASEDVAEREELEGYTFIDYVGEAQAAINPELVAVNPYYESDLAKNYDAMVEHMAYSDMRGRMIRAFPTYYLLLIDEGGYIFSYKLFDDFYGLSSVLDFSLHSSEDMVGDTLMLRLANFYGKLSTPITTGFNRLFSMGSAWNTKLEETWTMGRNISTKLTDAMGVPLVLDGKIVWSALDHIEMKPGVRLQLRAGYSSNINMLPTLFNGVVTEISAGDITTVTCQSDGVELLAVVNAGEKDGHSGCIDGAWFSGWDFSEPRDLIVELLTSGGSVYHQAISAATKGAVMGDSRFGIRHFGCIFWEPEKEEEVAQDGQRQNAVERMIEEYRTFLEMRDKLSLDEQPGGLTNAITTMLLGEDNFSDQLKKAFANMMSGKDTELYKRNIYPGNATGILEMSGVDKLQTTGAALDNLADMLLGIGAGGGGLLAGGALLLGHPYLAAISVILGSVGGWMVKGFIDNTGELLTEEQRNAPGTGITEVIGLTDPDKSGPEDPFCEISMQLYTYQRTVWDLLKDCAMLLPNYIVAVRPWEHRSTLFYGKPYWLYTSGVWPLTSGTNVTPGLRTDINDFLEALEVARVEEGKFTETIDKYKQGAGTVEQPSTSGAPALSGSDFAEVTNYLSITDSDAFSTTLSNVFRGCNNELPPLADVIIDICQERGVEPGLVVAMMMHECSGGGIEPIPDAAVWNNPGNYMGLKFEGHEDIAAECGGSMGTVSPEGADSHYMKFVSVRDGIDGCVMRLRQYIDGFYKCETDPDNASEFYMSFYTPGDVLLSIVSLWASNAAGKNNTVYKEKVVAYRQKIWEGCGSGINASDMPTTSNTAPPSELNFLDDSEVTLKQIREEVEEEEEIGGILETMPPPAYDSINKFSYKDFPNPWLELWCNSPTWWADMDYRDQDQGGDQSLISLLFLMKFRKLSKLSGSPSFSFWEDDLHDLCKMINNNDQTISGIELKEDVFNRRIVAIANNKHKIAWPTSVEECFKLNDTKALWEHLDVPCALDYIDSGIFDPEPEFIPRGSNVAALSEGPHPCISRITAGVWAARSQWHRRTIFQYFDPQSPSSLIDMGSEEMRCDNDTAWNIFEDLFRYGTGIDDNKTGGEFFYLWWATSVHGAQYTWARLTVDAWADPSRRPKIVDTLSAAIDAATLAGPSFLLGSDAGQNGSPEGRSEKHQQWEAFNAAAGTIMGQLESDPEHNAGALAPESFSLHDNHERSEKICSTIGANDDINRLICLVACIVENSNFFLDVEDYTPESTLERSALMTWVIYRYLESKINPEVFGRSKDTPIYMTDQELCSMVSSLDGRLGMNEVGIIKNKLEQVCKNAPQPSTGHATVEDFKSLGKILFAFVQTIILCGSPALFIPTNALSVEGTENSENLSGGGIYLPVYTLPILYAGADSDYPSQDPIPPHVWAKDLVAYLKGKVAYGSPEGWIGPRPAPFVQYLKSSRPTIRESQIFLTSSPRAIFRFFLDQFINQNDWSIAWIATTTGKSGIDLDEGTADFGPLCECFAHYLRSPENDKADATFKWMLEHQDIGDHEWIGAINALKGGVQTAFGFIEEMLKKLWGLALMGSGGFAAGISVARFMGNMSNILNTVYNDSIYYLEGVADNPFSREFQEPVVEIREPFQKFWIIDSFSDIIDNNMICSSEGVYTVVTAVSGGGNPQTVWADRSIYPEWQREKVVETNLRWEEPKWWEMIDGVLQGFKDKYLLDKGCPYDVQAKRVAVNALKESLKDMYGGEITILGRPEIRPFDIVYICDLYENICGLVEVEAVTHHFSVETGFITSIKPNALVAVDDPGKWNFAAQLHAAGSIMEAHKQLKRAATSANNGKTKQHTTTQGDQAIEEVVGAFKGGYADWLYNLSHGITPTYEEILDSAMEPVSGGVIAATNGQGVAQTEFEAVIDWFNSHALIKTEKWSRYGEAITEMIPLVGHWISNLFGGVADIFGWFRDNFIDYHPVSMFLLLKEGKPWAAGIDGHAGLVVGTPDRRSLLPGLLGGLIDLPTGDYVKPHDVLGRLGYTKMDSVNMIRSVNMFQAAAISRAERERGRLEAGVLPIGMAPDIYQAWVVNEYNDYPKGCIDGDTFYCTTIGPGRLEDDLTTSLSRPGVIEIRLSLIDCREYHPARGEDGKWVANPELGDWTDDLGNEHENELGGLECWEMLKDLLPAPGQPIWVVVNPYNAMDTYGRVPALIYDGSEFPTREAVIAAEYTQSINYKLYMLMAPAGYAQWMYPLPDTEYGPPGITGGLVD